MSWKSFLLLCIWYERLCLRWKGICVCVAVIAVVVIKQRANSTGNNRSSLIILKNADNKNERESSNYKNYIDTTQNSKKLKMSNR